jgi:hypothetical protein
MHYFITTQYYTNEIAVGPFIIACNRESLYLRVSKKFQVKATEKKDKASNFYIVRLDEDRYFSIVHEVSNDDPNDPIKRGIEEQCGKYKPGISLYLSASINWRGRSLKNKFLQMQMSGKRFLTQMALQSRRSKQFQPVKLAEWTSGKEVFFIRCRKRTTSGPRRSGTYLCVHDPEHRDKKYINAISGKSSQGIDDPLEGKDSRSEDDRQAQDSDGQSKGSKATQSSTSHDNQGEDDQAEGKSSQGNIGQADGQSNHGMEQAEEETTQISQSKESDDKMEGNTEKAEETTTKSNQNEDNQSDDEDPYPVRCEPCIDKHNGEDTFMLFRLLNPKIKKGMYLET